jgi:hypothetical protein
MTQCQTSVPLMLTVTPSIVFEKCSIDTIGTFCSSRLQHRYILTVQDELSTFLITMPLEDQTAEQLAKAFVDQLVLIYGMLQVMLSDSGSQF